MQVQELVGIVPWTFLARFATFLFRCISSNVFFSSRSMKYLKSAKADAEIQADVTKAKEEAKVMKAEYEKNMQDAKEKANDIY